jgi:GMP synthase-like glutamine amidotransferase
MVLVIDNYDSFTYNLVQYLGELGATVRVRRNNEVTLDEISTMAPEQIVISPGPGRPEDAGISIDVIRRFGPTTPLLGVCLGHQAIGVVYGGIVCRAQAPMHGKTSTVVHDSKGVFAGMTVSLTGHCERPRAERARGGRADEGRQHDHGRASPVVPGARRSIPSGVRAHRRRSPHPPQFPRDVTC